MTDPCRLLLAEDSPMWRRLVREFLARERFEASIDEAETIAEALDLLAARRYDCVLLDLVLADGEAWDVLAAAARNPEASPVIVLTGAGDELTAVRAVREGAVDYLPKPGLTRQRLAISIEHAIGDARMRRELALRRRAAHRASLKARSAATAQCILARRVVETTHDVLPRVAGALFAVRSALFGHAEDEPTFRPTADATIEGLTHALDLLNDLDRLTDDARRFGAGWDRAVQPHDVADLVCEVTELFLGEIADHVEFRVDARPVPGVPVVADAVRVIALELMERALDATREGGSILVETREDADHAVLAVTDSASLPPEGLTGPVVDPFALFDAGEEGFGLATAAFLAARMDASLVCLPAGERGSRIEVRFPRGAVPTMAPPRASAPGAEARPSPDPTTAATTGIRVP